MSDQTPTPTALDLHKLTDGELSATIKNLRLLLDLHIDERFRRIEEKQERTEK